MVVFPTFHGHPQSTWACIVKDEADFAERATRYNAGDRDALRLIGCEEFCEKFGAEGMMLAMLNPRSAVFDVRD
jgi:hypothetical protein